MSLGSDTTLRIPLCGHRYFLAVARKFCDPASRFRVLAKHRCGSAIKKNSAQALFFFIAGPRGIEPRLTVLETVVLPLNYRPIAMDSSLKRRKTKGFWR